MNENTLYRIDNLDSASRITAKNWLIDEGVLVPVEPDAIDIAARLSVEKYPEVLAPLVLDVVRDTLIELGIGDNE